MWWQRWNSVSYNKWMQQTSSKGVQDKAQLGGKGVPLRTITEIKIWPCYQMVYAQIRICPIKWDTKVFVILRNKWITWFGQKTKPSVNVAFWPSAELSNKRCTCVNNRCIRSKISGYHLDHGWVEFGANATLTGSRWTSNNYITSATESSS